MVRSLMASTASLATLTRPPARKKATADEEARGTPNATNVAPPAKAEDDDDKDDEEDDDSKAKKAKKAKKAESDDDDEEDDDSKARVRHLKPGVVHDPVEIARQARADERAKIRGILDSPVGSAAFEANPDKVMRFLTSYSGTQEDAIATLELLAPTEKPQSRQEPLRERMMNSAPVPSAGPSGASESGQSDVVALILSADKMRRNEK